MSNEPIDHESILNSILVKLSEINHLSMQLPLNMRHDVYAGAKRHFYIGQCLTNKQIKADKNVRTKRNI